MLIFWILAALMTMVALAFVLWPLVRRAPAEVFSESVEMAVYSSQLGAIEDAEQAGRIAEEDAKATRTEVKRRMLAKVRQRKREAEGAGVRRPMGARERATILVLLGVATPLLALTIYLSGGRPDLPDEPFGARSAERAAAGVPSQEEQALVRELAERMAKHPEDPRGWVLLGAAYVRQNRYDEAVAAYDNANARKPGDADILAALGEAEVLQAGGEITEEARVNFEAAKSAAPGNMRARYFLALAQAQAGDFAGAATAWSELIKDAPADAPWRKMVEAQIAQAKRASEGSNDLLAGANAEQMAKLSPAERQAMIEQMVARLAARLDQSPRDLDGWLRLAKSYSVLGEPQRAVTALNKAAEAFRGDAAALQQINRARAGLGPSTGTFGAEN